MGGIEQVVVTGTGTELARRLRADGVRTREAGWRAGLDPRALLAVAAELRLGPSLVHAHDAHSLRLAGLASSYFPRPLIATRRVVFPLRRTGYWSRADRVIAVSDAVAAVLRAGGIDHQRITVVHSGIDLREVERATSGAVRARLGLPADALLAVCVGALGKDKDHATLLRAAGLLLNRCRQLHWAIAGEGPERPALERLRDELGLRGRAHLLGEVEEPLGVIADGDIFVMSSRHEGLGTSVLDAMALGIPVASTAAGGLPEVLAGGAGLVVPSGEPAALADAVARLAADADLRRELQTRARIAVRRFSAERMAGQILTVYRSCAPLT